MSDSVPRTPSFLGMPPGHSDPATSKFIVLPIPFEATTVGRKGTRHGPDAIIRASYHLEGIDEELGTEPWKEGVATLAALDVSGPAPDVFARAAGTVEPHVRRGALVISLGGEHALSEGPLAGVARVHRDVTVLHIDAHADLRDEYRGSKYNHACAARRMMEIAPIVQVGIRSVGGDEIRHCNSRRAKTFFQRENRDVKKLIPKVLKALGPKVYISLDLDGLDPSVVPGVGTPVPGGLGWYETLDLLRAVVQNKRVVGADVVELCPQPDSPISEYAAAKLVYKIVAYAARKGRK